LQKVIHSVSGNIAPRLFDGLFVNFFLFLERGGGYRVLMKKPEGQRTGGRPRRRWEDNIKMDLQELG
jgi:hypothetical protein